MDKTTASHVNLISITWTTVFLAGDALLCAAGSCLFECLILSVMFNVLFLLGYFVSFSFYVKTKCLITVLSRVEMMKERVLELNASDERGIEVRSWLDPWSRTTSS